MTTTDGRSDQATRQLPKKSHAAANPKYRESFVRAGNASITLAEIVAAVFRIDGREAL
jgi:hypothetical protein